MQLDLRARAVITDQAPCTADAVDTVLIAMVDNEQESAFASM